MGWLLHAMGVDTTTGPLYAFWSGAGSDLGEVALLGGMITLVRKHNCHERRCWRVGRHVVEGTPWCNHHHEAARAAQ